MDLRPNLRFLTTYRKDYINKKLTKVKGSGGKQQFKDPINEGFRHYLTLNEENVDLPLEDGETFLEDKFKKNYKKLGEVYFKEPLAKHDIIVNNIVRGCVTEYQTKYCDIVKDIEFRKEKFRHKVALPEDIKLIETTYLSTYREPASVCPFTVSKRVLPIPPNVSLGANENINKILNVKTGTTEYTDRIGTLGEFITKNHIHGNIHQNCK